MTRTHTTKLNRLDETESEVTVEYTISPYYPATYDDPAEGGEVEIVSAWADLATANDVLLLSVPIALTNSEDEKFCAWICENHDHDDGPDPDDERDRRRDERMTQ